jgi:hypothetical protein
MLLLLFENIPLLKELIPSWDGGPINMSLLTERKLF